MKSRARVLLDDWFIGALPYDNGGAVDDEVYLVDGLYLEPPFIRHTMPENARNTSLTLINTGSKCNDLSQGGGLRGLSICIPNTTKFKIMIIVEDSSIT